MATDIKFPLFQHRNGQWAKKVRGKLRYFGTDKDQALDKWLAERDYLLNDRPVPTESEEPTLSELGNVFIDRCRKRVSADDGLTERTVDDYQKSIERFIAAFGSLSRLSSITPLDFENFKLSLFEPTNRADGHGRQVKKRSAVTVNGDVRAIRTWLNWATKNKLAENVDYGDGFTLLGKKQRRKLAASRGRKDFPKEFCQLAIQKATVPMRSMIYLALNAGLGNGDLAAMRASQLIQRGGETWVDYPRPKTGAQRRFVLWPETQEAIEAYLAQRPKPTQCEPALLFVTKGGREWLRKTKSSRTDEVGNQFAALRKKVTPNLTHDIAEWANRNAFYGLRHTFRTVAAQAADPEAVELVMGHVESDEIAANYSHEINDDRIRNVCFAVRNWLI